MRILVGYGGELELPFGSALTGMTAKTVEISWAELDKYILQNGEKRCLAYINRIVRCRLLEGGEFRIRNML